MISQRKNKEILSIAVLVQTTDGQFHRVALNHSDYFDLIELLRTMGDALHLDDEELRNFTFDAPSLKKPFPVAH